MCVETCVLFLDALDGCFLDLYVRRKASSVDGFR